MSDETSLNEQTRTQLDALLREVREERDAFSRAQAQAMTDLRDTTRRHLEALEHAKHDAEQARLGAETALRELSQQVATGRAELTSAVSHGKEAIAAMEEQSVAHATAALSSHAHQAEAGVKRSLDLKESELRTLLQRETEHGNQTLHATATEAHRAVTALQQHCQESMQNQAQAVSGQMTDMAHHMMDLLRDRSDQFGQQLATGADQLRQQITGAGDQSVTLIAHARDGALSAVNQLADGFTAALKHEAGGILEQIIDTGGHWLGRLTGVALIGEGVDKLTDVAFKHK